MDGTRVHRFTAPTLPTRMRGLEPALWIGALVALCFGAAAVRRLPYFAQDFDSVYAASLDVVDGRAVYSSAEALLPYLYPPSSAVAGTPFTLLGLGAAQRVALVVGVGALVAAALFSARLAVRAGAPTRHTSGLALLLVALWQPSFDALANVNTSLVLAPVVPAFLLLTLRRRHLAAAVLLGLSFALKPLLLPLIVVPLLYRRPRSAVIAVAIPVLATLASLPLIADGHEFFSSVVPKLVSGDAGRLGTHNMSLANLDDLAGLAEPAVLVVRVVVVMMAVGVAVAIWRREGNECLRLVEVTGALLVGFLSAGGTDESHYQLMLLPLVVCVLAPGSRLRSALGGLGVVLFSYRGEVIFLSSSQSGSMSLWRALGLVLVLTTLAIAAFGRRGDGDEPDAPARPQSEPAVE